MDRHSCHHHFSRGTIRTVSMYRQIALPHCHIKTAARTNFTGKYGILLFEKGEKSFGSVLAANCTLGKEFWRGASLKLCQSCSKSGKVIWRRWNLIVAKHNNLLASGCYEPSVNSQMVVQCSMCKKGEWPESPGCTVEWRKWPSAPGTRSPSRGPPEARLGCCNGAHGSRQREATRAKLPLTSSITLEERKRGSDGAAHQYTSHPRFRPTGLYG